MTKNWPSSLGHQHTPEAIAKRLGMKRHPSLVRDFVYGAIDGTVTTFSIVAGVSGADLPNNVILILGISNVLADGFSMAAGNYLGTKSEHDEAELLKSFEIDSIKNDPEGEIEEVRQIFRAKGFEGELLEKSVEKIVQNREEWLRTMLAEEYGIASNGKSPLRAGAFTFLAFVLFGLIPMLPYIIGLKSDLKVAAILTGLSFILLGAVKSIWSLESSWVSGLKTFMIGALAASLAYFVGGALKGFVH